MGIFETLLITRFYRFSSGIKKFSHTCNRMFKRIVSTIIVYPIKNLIYFELTLSGNPEVHISTRTHSIY